MFCAQGHFTVISKFMLTYLTKGPGKFTIDDYSNLLTLFWLLFVVSRLLTAFLAFRINSLVFMFVLFLINVIANLIFLIPYLTTFKSFFWIGISLMGWAMGPLIPSTFMVAKDVIKNYNSFVLSIFSVGMGLGSIFFQQITGDLLDLIGTNEYKNVLGFEDFNSAYVIAYLFFIPCAISFTLYIISLIIYKKNFHLIK